MIENVQSIEQLIRSHVSLGNKASTGFEMVKCLKCNDYKVRAGFKFDTDTIRYSCFNCGIRATQYTHSIKINDTMKDVLKAFMVPVEELNTAASSNFFKEFKEKPIDTNEKKVKYPGKIDLPPKAELLESSNTEWSLYIKEYVKSRNLPSNFPFYISSDEKYIGRLIIPYFFRNNIIYWQARSIDDSLISPRYKNPSINTESVFFNMDELYRYTSEPLIITEGFSDALIFGKNGISLTTSGLNSFKRGEISKVKNRRKIFLIDKNKPGYLLGQTALSLGENIELCIFPEDIDDANDCTRKLGKIWTVNYVLTNSKKDTEAKLLLDLKIKYKIQ
jgi:hypothetical protein